MTRGILTSVPAVVSGYEALTGPGKIRGFEGDTVSLQCTYTEKLREHKKYWCKKRGTLLARCSGIIYAREDGRERTEGRVSIQDDPQKLTLNVTLRELSLEDAGDYWCGISMLGRDETLQVSLVVLPGEQGLSFRGRTEMPRGGAGRWGVDPVPQPRGRSASWGVSQGRSETHRSKAISIWAQRLPPEPQLSFDSCCPRSHHE